MSNFIIYHWMVVKQYFYLFCCLIFEKKEKSNIDKKLFNKSNNGLMVIKICFFGCLKKCTFRDLKLAVKICPYLIFNLHLINYF